jgi:hypothetical protein
MGDLNNTLLRWQEKRYTLRSDEALILVAMLNGLAEHLNLPFLMFPPGFSSPASAEWLKTFDWGDATKKRDGTVSVLKRLRRQSTR